MGWSQTQDSEEKVNKLIYNSKVHRCCSGKRFVVSGVQVPNSQGAPQLLFSLNLKGLCTVETSFTNCFLFYCPMKTEAILQFYNKYWQEKRWSQTGEFVISKCPESNGRDPGQVPPLKHTKYINTDRGEGGKEQWERASGGPAQENSGTMTVMVFCSEYTFDRIFFSSQIKNMFLFLNFTTMLQFNILLDITFFYWNVQKACKRQFSMQDVSEVSEELHT